MGQSNFKLGHRKRVKHYDDPSHCHKLTFSCYHRMPLLTNDRWRGLLSRGMDFATDKQPLGLAAFVLMPEHVHLLVFPKGTPANIDGFLKSLKQSTSRRIKNLLVEKQSRLLARLTVRERPGKMVFRFWQEGPGYDRNLDNPDSVLAAIDYIHLNPVTRGLVKRAEDWRWSSARWYATDGQHLDAALPRLERLPAEFLQI